MTSPGAMCLILPFRSLFLILTANAGDPGRPLTVKSHRSLPRKVRLYNLYFQTNQNFVYPVSVFQLFGYNGCFRNCLVGSDALIRIVSSLTIFLFFSARKTLVLLLGRNCHAAADVRIMGKVIVGLGMSTPEVTGTPNCRGML